MNPKHPGGLFGAQGRPEGGRRAESGFFGLDPEAVGQADSYLLYLALEEGRDPAPLDSRTGALRTGHIAHDPAVTPVAVRNDNTET